MIIPTVGRVVLFHPGANTTGIAAEKDQPLAAIVAYVWNPRLVNLAVFDHNGLSHGRTSVQLLQDEDKPHFEDGPYAEWMPYQKGQAAKTDKLEEELARRPAPEVVIREGGEPVVPAPAGTILDAG